MTTLEMLENVRDFVIANIGTGTTSILLGLSKINQNIHVLEADRTGVDAFLNNFPYGHGAKSIQDDLHGYKPGPVFVDNHALLQITELAILEIEKLNKEIHELGNAYNN